MMMSGVLGRWGKSTKSVEFPDVVQVPLLMNRMETTRVFNLQQFAQIPLLTYLIYIISYLPR